MNYKLTQIKSKQEWNPLSINPDTTLFQSYEYAQWQKQTSNRNSYLFKFTKEDEVLAYAFFIECPLARSLVYLYSPYGPIISKQMTHKDFDTFKNELKKVFKNTPLAFIRLDFPEKPPFQISATKSTWFSYHGACFQPRREWVIDLSKPEEELLKAMHQKTRYNIRLAKRKGIEIEIVRSNIMEYLDIFYELLSYTAKLKKYSIHNKQYYKLAFEYAKSNNGFLAIARKQGEEDVLVANLILSYGQNALFAFGGQADKHKNLMPNYLAHWQSMLELKKQGVRYYSFGGYFDENGPKIKKSTLAKRETFSVFKRKFGGFSRDYYNMFDIVTNWPAYILWNVYKFIKRP